jgi:hypothetical protein
MHWLVRATWDGSLIFSLFCVILAFHLSIVMSTADIRHNGKMELMESLRRDSESSPSIIGLFILQAPVLLLSYAIMSYLVGLALMVVSPLWNDPTPDEQKVEAPFQSLRRKDLHVLLDCSYVYCISLLCITTLFYYVLLYI